MCKRDIKLVYLRQLGGNLSYRNRKVEKQKPEFLVKSSKVEVLELIYSVRGNSKAMALNAGSMF